MYVHNFAYTLYNAEFRQESDFEVKHRCYQRAFSRYVYITYFWSYTGETGRYITYTYMLAFEPPTGWGHAHTSRVCPRPAGCRKSARYICAFDLPVLVDIFDRTP